MRIILTFSLILLLLSSCSKYQYLTLSSNDTGRNEKNQFIVDNDSFRIAYDFYGFNGPLQLDITNKQHQLLEIDWSRSFIIKGGRPDPLFKPVGAISGELERDGISRTALINASIVQPSPLELVPRGATVTKSGPVVWPVKKLVTVDRRDMKKVKMKIKGFKKKVWKAGIKDTSSLSFRVYLTLNPRSGASPVVIDRSFYATGLVETRVEPQEMPGRGQGNIILLHGPTRFNRMGFLIAGVVLGGAAVIASSTL
ncbi:MAG TPA: hypothetical protein VHM26_02550 [Chitinophagaceae bacterium]|jgi:hypothetical protein|nr:hypothetical protein [Chitinophagaceae bacterium]